MSGVKIFFPKPILAQLIRESGGMTIADALQQVDANLDELKPPCLELLRETVQKIEHGFDEALHAGATPPTGVLYALASGGVGLGAVAGIEAADTAMASLCKLLDHLQSANRWDPAAVAVHVQALKFLANATDLAPGDAEGMLKGLERVTAQNSPGH